MAQQQTLERQCNVGDSTWMVEDDELHVVLAKVFHADLWPCVFKGHKSLNVVEAEDVKKQLMLERFSQEVPSQAPGLRLLGRQVQRQRA